VLQTLDTAVLAAVTPAYKAMETAVKTLRGRVEPVIREKVGPLFEAKEAIKEKIKSMTMKHFPSEVKSPICYLGAILETVNPTLSEKVSPRLAGIVQILTSPVRMNGEYML
jgi:hypothetical protein